MQMEERDHLNEVHQKLQDALDAVKSELESERVCIIVV